MLIPKYFETAENKCFRSPIAVISLIQFFSNRREKAPVTMCVLNTGALLNNEKYRDTTSIKILCELHAKYCMLTHSTQKEWFTYAIKTPKHVTYVSWRCIIYNVVISSNIIVTSRLFSVNAGMTTWFRSYPQMHLPSVYSFKCSKCVWSSMLMMIKLFSPKLTRTSTMIGMVIFSESGKLYRFITHCMSQALV